MEINKINPLIIEHDGIRDNQNPEPNQLLKSLYRYFPSLDQDFLKKMVETYKEYCGKCSIRMVVPIAQVIDNYVSDPSLLKTNCNPGKLASMSSAKNLATFETIESGVKAHIQRLNKMLGYDEESEGQIFDRVYDPRLKFAVRGILGNNRFIIRLSGPHSWEDPGYDKTKYRSLEDAEADHDTYGYRILKLVGDLCNDVPDMGDISVESTPIIPKSSSTTPITNQENNPNNTGESITKVAADQFMELVDFVYEKVEANYNKKIRNDTFPKGLRLIFYRTKNLEEAKLVTYFVIKNLTSFHSGDLNGSVIIPKIYIVRPKVTGEEFSIQFVPDPKEWKKYGSKKMDEIKRYMKTDEVRKDVILNPIISFY